MTTIRFTAPLAAAIWMTVTPCHAQDAGSGVETEAVDQFAQAIAERDATIAQLTARIERLERILLTQAHPSASPISEPGLPGASEDVERALERSLVQGGAILIAPGSIELTPSFSYAYSTAATPFLSDVDGTPAIVTNEQRQSFVEARLGARIGLPGNTQFDLSVPYRLAFREDVASLGGTPFASVGRDASAIGDVTLSLSHVLAGDGQAIPRLIGRIRGNLGTASRSAGEGLLGGGFAGIGVSLGASQRLDPLVFAGSISYDTLFSEGGIDPGDRWGYSLAAYLAASPETSLRIQFDQQFLDDLTLAGTLFEGSGGTSATMGFGASVITGRRSLIDLDIGIGLTENTPDLALTVSMPLQVSR